MQAFYWNQHSSSIDRDCIKARLSTAQRLKAEILNFLQFHVVENLRYISFYFTKTASFLLRFLLWWPINVRYYSIHRICLAFEQRNLLFGSWAVKRTEILLMEMSAGFGNPWTFYAGYFKQRKSWFKKIFSR